jgi:hypothetical protein
VAFIKKITIITHYHRIITALSHLLPQYGGQFPDLQRANAREFSPLRCEMTALMGLAGGEFSHFDTKVGWMLIGSKTKKLWGALF